MKKDALASSGSYMELCLRPPYGEDLYLRIPTVWDQSEKQWIGFIKTPSSKELIYGSGKDSMDLQNSFNKCLKEKMENPELQAEIMSMFKPLKDW